MSTCEPSLNTINAEQLWVDVALRNPLNVPVTLTGLTLLVESSDSEGSSNDLEVEIIEEIYLNAKELRTVRVTALHRRLMLKTGYLGRNQCQSEEALYNNLHAALLLLLGSASCF